MDGIKLHLECSSHKLKNIVKVILEEIVNFHVTQLDMNVGTVTQIECQGT